MNANPVDPAPNDLHSQENTTNGHPSRRAKLTSEVAIGAALELIADGFPVFPLRANGKEPLFPSAHGMDDPKYGVCKGECDQLGHGSYDATTDPEVVKKWWGGNGVDDTVPNIGQALPGYVALDPDGDEGKASLAALEEKFGKLAPTRVHETGSGGLHIIFKDPEGKFHSQNQGLGARLDLKAGMGSYLVAPTSIHPKTRRPYRVLERRTPAPAPEYLSDAIRELAISLSGSEPDGDRTPLADLLEEGADKGNRDEWLTKVAGHYARSFAKFEDFHALLRATNDVRCDPPLTDREVKKVARSVWNREKAKPDPETRLTEALANPEVFEQSPEFQAKLWDQFVFHRANEKAKILMAPGNRDIPEPTNWARVKDESVERDYSNSGLIVQPGWVTLVMGDFEAAKTMMFLWIAAEKLRKGETVLFIDEESPESQTWDKLEAFQLTDEELSRFIRYDHPGWNLVTYTEVLDELMKRHPGTTLIGFDSYTRLIEHAGLEDDNAGARQIYVALEGFAARANVRTYLIDHQGHAGGNHARNATTKAQQASIVARLVPKKKFKRDQDGSFDVIIHKHRNGINTGDTFTVNVTTTDDGPLRMEWTKKPPKSNGDSDTESPTLDAIGSAAKVINAVKKNGGEMDNKAIQAATKLSRSTVTTALGHSLAKKHLKSRPDSKYKGKLWWRYDPQGVSTDTPADTPADSAP